MSEGTMTPASEGRSPPEVTVAPIEPMQRRVQLGDLPYEVKENIARFCHGADFRTKEFFADLKARGDLPNGS
ncbi:hypothetical protein JCM10908_000496 [Rhodotorula pacifica]|uniref:uncharacterized protein n=1 Tax=Rhodotorula pacifica TaxID=1495444 RepID=UPI00316BD372